MLLDSIRRYKKIIIILTSLLLIILVGLAIYSLDNKVASPTDKYLSEYLALEKKISDINDSSTLQGRVIEEMNIVGNQDTSLIDRYKALEKASLFLASDYAETKDPKYRNLINSDFVKFASTNFPKQFKKEDFILACQDSTCADNPQPQVITNIINEINQSDIEAYLKTDIIENLKNTGYLSDKYPVSKFSEYYSTLLNLRSYTQHSTSSSMLKIAEELADYLNTKYPDQYKQAESAPHAGPTTQETNHSMIITR